MSLAQQILLCNYLIIFLILLIWAYKERTGVKRIIVNTNGHSIYKLNYSKTMLCFLAVPIIIWAGTRGDVEDTSNYRRVFRERGTGIAAIKGVFEGTEKGKGYQILSIIIKTIIGNRDVIFFIIIAMLVMVCLMCVYREYSCMLPMTIFLFVVSVDCYQWMFNGMRQFIAVVISFLAMKYLLEKKTLLFVLLILLASTIHSVALVTLVALYFVNKKPWSTGVVVFIIGFLVVLFFLGSFTDILEEVLVETNYSNVVSQFESDDGVSLIRVFVWSIPVLLALFCRKRIEELDDKVINFAVNMSLISTCLYVLGMFTSGIYIGRIPIFFSLWNHILLPWEIRKLFTPRSRSVVVLVMIMAYLVFNYYQMNVFMVYYW